MSFNYGFNAYIPQVSEITPYIYLTSVYGASKDNIYKRSVTLLVNAAQELPKQEMAGVESIKLFLEDTPYANINVYFDRIADKMQQHVSRGGKVLVHCVLGVSRSTSLVIAYLMKYKKMTLKDAFNLVSSRRPCVRPNQGFWRQLIDYEKQLLVNNTSSISKSQGHFDIVKSTSSSAANGAIDIPIQIPVTGLNYGKTTSYQPMSAVNILTPSAASNNPLITSKTLQIQSSSAGMAANGSSVARPFSSTASSNNNNNKYANGNGLIVGSGSTTTTSSTTTSSSPYDANKSFQFSNKFYPTTTTTMTTMASNATTNASTSTKQVQPAKQTADLLKPQLSTTYRSSYIRF